MQPLPLLEPPSLNRAINCFCLAYGSWGKMRLLVVQVLRMLRKVNVVDQVDVEAFIANIHESKDDPGQHSRFQVCVWIQ